jgi:hypothetical protein
VSASGPLAALVRGRLCAVAWFATAKMTGLTPYLPLLALTEVRAVRPDAGPQLAEVLSHPSPRTPPEPTEYPFIDTAGRR